MVKELWASRDAAAAPPAKPSGEPTRLTVVGQVVGATGFSAASAHCLWRIVAGESWKQTAGLADGSSHSDAPSDKGTFVFQHPIDASFDGTSNLRDWPRLELEVRGRDSNDRSDIAGYASCPVPTEPGVHSLRCRMWRPRGSLGDRISSFFIGARPQLRDNRLVFGIERGEGGAGKSLARGVASSQQTLATEPNGEVLLTLSVFLRTLPPPVEP